MTKTVKEHLENCKEVSQVIDDANALLTKAKAELEYARACLDALLEYQHPKVSMDTNYQVRRIVGDERKAVTPGEVIKAQVARINALLGDRA